MKSADPGRPQLDLLQRFLPGNIKYLIQAFRQIPADLQEQRRLSDSGIPAHQHKRSWDKASSQYLIQFAHSGKDSVLFSGLYLTQGHRF